MGKITVKVYELYRISDSLNKLLSQDIEYPVKIAYKLYKMNEDINDRTRYVYERLSNIIDSDNMSKNCLSESERIVYDATMNSEIELTPFDFDEKLIFNNDKVKLTVEDVSLLKCLFKTDE